LFASSDFHPDIARERPKIAEAAKALDSAPTAVARLAQLTAISSGPPVNF